MWIVVEKYQMIDRKTTNWNSIFAKYSIYFVESIGEKISLHILNSKS